MISTTRPSCHVKVEMSVQEFGSSERLACRLRAVESMVDGKYSGQYLLPSKLCAVSSDCIYLGVLLCSVAPGKAEVEGSGM